MIGSKRTGSKASSALGVLGGLLKKADVKDSALRLGLGASSKETNWNAIEAAKVFEATRQSFDLERARALLRRY